ncbi:GW dipeptide domain-containing protein [Virgibacillus necropolis]|uniref:GW domain-containing protein n=1 Tax=Virgibacillus necropolis TaxID=163877 RepID=A0A221M923_9BACI|nr:GW dipeptide domain-containing protein [Virgibacillus necropolis]ASN04120.1 hypothetical protein CFK40_03425 [Virgibacillus necropolis]
MKKTAIVIITFLLFTLSIPSQIFANDSKDSKVNESDVKITNVEDKDILKEKNTTEGLEKDEGNSPSVEKDINNQTSEKEADKSQSQSSLKTEDEPKENTQDTLDNTQDTLDNTQESEKVNPEKNESVIEKDSSTNEQENIFQEKKESDTTNETNEKSTEKKASVNTLTVPNTFSVADINKSNTSRLGHIQSESVNIYENLTDMPYITAGEKYTNQVYYIKQQAVIKGQTYYLISLEPSKTRGVVGWVKADDLSTYSHTGVDSDSKTFYIKGTGSAYNKAWGGSKNLVYGDMSKFANHKFTVHLTEAVGTNTWYRGQLNGKTIWLHEAYVKPLLKSNTSKLGHIKSERVQIYKDLGVQTSSFTAGETYTNQVYYIKEQANLEGQTYYLISLKPSRTSGVVGWVKAKDLSTYSHTGVDRDSKSFYIKGTGSAYSKAWGGSKDLVYEDMSKYANYKFTVHLTEAVGTNTWYRGQLNGKTIWLHEAYVVTHSQSHTSKLGHIVSSNVKIFTDPYSNSSYKTAEETYTNQVYYIKEQAVTNGQTYYLISIEPSRTNGVIGWVRAEDLSTYSHTSVNSNVKTFYIKGTGSAYSKAWGGSKDLVYEDMSQYINEEFTVHLTEAVGSNTWYRGKLNGKTIWLHEAYVKSYIKSNTSKLGHIKSAKVKIYNSLESESSYKTAGEKYTNQVYYIKEQAFTKSQSYYLISLEPSRVNGVVGWVKAEDLSTYSHTGVDSQQKTFIIEGTGNAYNKAWGGSKNVVYSDLSNYRNKEFVIDLTEAVGGNIWYRGQLSGKTVWIHESFLKKVIDISTFYNMTLDEMVDIQMTATPQTDKRYKLWIREDAFDSITDGVGTINNNVWNLRRGPGTMYARGGQVAANSTHHILDSSIGADEYTWYNIKYTSGWVTPDIIDLRYYLNPANFLDTFRDKLQFLKLSQTAGIDVNEVNEKILIGKGVLEGKAQAFVEASRTYGVNEIYLISHALLETGNGASALATGVKVDGDQGERIVYNMYGTGAYDDCPLLCGANYAYEQGWFTPELAIKGGARFVGENYVSEGQDTLYKIRWDPLFASNNGRFGHQYATDIRWAYKQTERMSYLYSLLNGYKLILDIPVYK